TGFAVTVSAKGFVRDSKSLESNDSYVSFSLRPGVRLSGRVIDARTERPIAGARVEAHRFDWHRGITRVAEASTDDDGAFALDDVPAPPGGPIVSVRAAGRAAW